MRKFKIFKRDNLKLSKWIIKKKITVKTFKFKSKRKIIKS